MLGQRRIVVSGVEVVAEVRSGGAPPALSATPSGDVEVDATDGAQLTLAVPDDVRTRLREAYLILSYRADPA